MRDKKTFPHEEAGAMSSAQIGKYLQEREKKFHMEYLRCLNGTEAAVRAGYSAGKKNASAATQAARLLRCSVGQAYRQALLQEAVEDATLSRESVCVHLTEIFRRCMKPVPVTVYNHETGEHKESGVWQFDTMGAIKALGMICTLMGFNSPKRIDVGGDGLEALLQGMT